MISHHHRELQPGTITLPYRASLKLDVYHHGELQPGTITLPYRASLKPDVYHHRELQPGTITLPYLVSPKLDDISPSQRTPAWDHHTPQSSVSEADNFSLGSYSSIL